MHYSLKNPMPIVVLISGNGSNLQAIIDAIAAKKLAARICAVISNRADAFGLERARKAHIPVHVITKTDFPDKIAYDDALKTCVENYHPQLIVLAGFMQILTSAFVKHFAGKIMNIHPSLLPKYRGLHTHAQVLAEKEKEHGVTIHWVTEDLDAGPIIAQEKISVFPDDNLETLTARIHEVEHRLYPRVIQKYAEGRVRP